MFAALFVVSKRTWVWCRCTYMKLGVMFTESLASVEDLFAVRAAPCQPLLMKLFLVRLPVWL